jgi:hypothetical protein
MGRESRLLRRAERLEQLSVELSGRDDLAQLGDALLVLQDDDDTVVRRMVRRRAVGDRVVMGDPATDETYVVPRVIR